jgi:hypothetical protein
MYLTSPIVSSKPLNTGEDSWTPLQNITKTSSAIIAGEYYHSSTIPTDNRDLITESNKKRSILTINL